MEDIKRIQSEIDMLLEKEEMAWMQRAKQHWYKYGDRNSKFFHHYTNQRRKLNHISSVEDERGNLFTVHDEISQAFTSHFQQVYDSLLPTGID